MASEFLGLEIGKRGLLTNQTALNVVSHNLSNASNKDYSRQVVNLDTVSPLYAPQYNREGVKGQIGQGSQIASITRVRDQFIDERIIEEKSSQDFYKTQSKYLTQIQQIFSEPGQVTLKEKFDDFIKGWNDLALNPSDMSTRNALVSSSQGMVSMIQAHYSNLEDMRNNINSLVETKVNEINSFATQIRDLNKEIVKSKALGDHPNDLLDKRDALIDKLSELTNIKVSERDPDEIFIYIGSKVLVQGEKVSPLIAAPNADKNGLIDIKYTNNTDISITKGELAGLLDIRDNQIGDAMQKLNNFAINLAKTVNDIHKQGFGLNRNTGLDFFTIEPLTTDSMGNYDANSDGVNDTTRLYSVTGDQKVNLSDKVNEGGVLNLGADSSGKDVLITYRATDTVEEIITRINDSSAPVTAHLNSDNKLAIKSLYNQNPEESFYIKYLEDSGNFLTSFTGILSNSNAEGAFDSSVANAAAQLITNDYAVSYAKNAATHLTMSAHILNDASNISVRGGKDTSGNGVIDTPNGGGDSSLGFKIIAALTSNLNSKSIDPNVKIDQNAVILDKGVSSFRPFLDNMITNIGETARTSKTNLDKEEAIVTGLLNFRQNISGVNNDEELVQMMKYQRSYQGAAKIIQTMNSMLDTIINLGK